jgi:AAA15 family ATPase/GTPase
MILEYSVKNYTVFKETVHLSFVASNYDKTTLELENVEHVPQKRLRILRTAVVHGANASGKTKLLESMAFFRKFVLDSSKESQIGEDIPTKPFLLCEGTKNEPSEFEIIFFHDQAIFRYGFEVTRKQVLSEWLFYKCEGREHQIFYRDTIDHTLQTHAKYFKKGDLLRSENLVRDNALMLSVAAQFNDALCSTVVQWFQHGVAVLPGLGEYGYTWYEAKVKEQPLFHQRMMDLMKMADLAILDIHMKVPVRHKVSDAQDSAAPACETEHYVYDENESIIGKIEFSMDEDESHGTRRFFSLAGHILDALDQGRALFIDEFDARLHPNIVLALVSLFNDPSINTKGAQLVATIQNTIVLQSDRLRKDQIWFVEKNACEASHLYALSEFKSVQVRKSENFETNYLQGKYGAVPYIQRFNHGSDVASEQEKPWPQEK